MIRLLKVKTPAEIYDIINKPITEVTMSIENNHIHMTLQIGERKLEAVSFYEEDNNILFNIIGSKSCIIKYTNDIGILTHSFINEFINSHDNFFTRVYYLEQVAIKGFELPISPRIDEDGNFLTLEERFQQLSNTGEHYIEIIERVDGDLLNYQHRITIDNLKAWSNQLWNMYSFLHMFNITYDDIKPNNIGYIMNGDDIIIKMIDLESLRYVNDNYTINLMQSGLFKTSKYYTFNNYLYDSVDILSMIFALFNAYCKHKFSICKLTLTELMGFDCSEIEKHFFNFSDVEFCSNYKFMIMMFTIYYMTEYYSVNTRFGLNSFNKLLLEYDIPEEFAWIISNIGLYLFMYNSDMLTLQTQDLFNPKHNPYNIQRVFKDFDVSNVSNVSHELINTNCFDNVLEITRPILEDVFNNYREFVIKTYDIGTFKILAKMLYK